MSSSERSGLRAGYASAIDDITARGGAAPRDTLRDSRAGLEDVVADVSEKGREALQGAREVRDTVADAVLTSVQKRPYTTLAIAAMIGFAYGAMRRR